MPPTNIPADIFTLAADWPPVRNAIVLSGGFGNDVGEAHAASFLFWQFQNWIDAHPRTSTAAVLVEHHFDAGDYAACMKMLGVERIYFAGYSRGGGRFYPRFSDALAKRQRGIRIACLLDPVPFGKSFTGGTLRIRANTERLWTVRQQSRGLFRIKGSRPVLASEQTFIERDDRLAGVDHARIWRLPELHREIVGLITSDIQRHQLREAAGGRSC